MATPEATADVILVDALGALGKRIEDLRLPLSTAGAADGRKLQHDVVDQLNDYVLPRMRRLDAPLMAVVGGSTGAGKSTLVNSIMGEQVTAAGALRPTTRAPVLVHHPDDAGWFVDDRILPTLPRVTGSSSAAGELHLVAEPSARQGLALLDAPDIDSVVSENRALASQLLGAADLWLFVTTAARYADAVPWDLLDSAANRSAAVAIVLDRVPPEAIDAVRADLARMLTQRGLGDSPLFVIPEVQLNDDGLLPAEIIEPIQQWLGRLADDEAARDDVIRKTLNGAIDGVLDTAASLADAAEQQRAADAGLRAIVTESYATARDKIEQAISDGSMLRGEVLARWQDFVGTGEFFRTLESKVGRARDRLGAFLRGKPQPTHDVEVAIEHGVQAVLVDEAHEAAERADTGWRMSRAGSDLLGDVDLARATDNVSERSAAAVRAWQGAILAMIGEEGADKRFTARMLSFGVNGLGLALMVVVFASTAGLTGVEVGVAGGTAVVGQKLLEAIFGDQAVRRLAEHARDDLSQRAADVLALEAARFTSTLDEQGIDDGAPTALRGAILEVRHAGSAGS